MSTPFTIDHLLATRRLVGRVPLDVSPDGRYVAVSVRVSTGVASAPVELGFRPDGVYVAHAGNRQIVVDTEAGQVMCPFPEGLVSWGGRWSPDGAMLAAYLCRDGCLCPAVWSPATGEWQAFPQAPVHVKYDFEVPRWTPDGEQLVLKLWPESGSAPTASWPDPGHAADQPHPVKVLTTEPPSGGEGTVSVDSVIISSLGDLAVLDVGSGQVRRLGRDWPIRCWQVAPDGASAAALKMTERSGGRIYYDLAVVELESGEEHTVAARVRMGYGMGFHWSPDGRHLAYAEGDEEEGGGSHAFLTPADGSAPPVCITGDAPVSLGEYGGPVWTADGSHLCCLGRDSVLLYDVERREAKRVSPDLQGRQPSFWLQPPLADALVTDAEGRIGAILIDPGTKDMAIARVDPWSGETDLLAQAAKSCVTPFDAAPGADGKSVWLALEAGEHPVELWRLATADGALTRVAGFSPVLKGVSLGRPRLVEWDHSNGSKSRGALMLPDDYEEGRPLPLIVNVYAIGFSSFVNMFGFDGWHYDSPHLWTSRGYAVLWPDGNLPDEEPMAHVADVILPAVDRLVEMGIADPDRIGLMAHSYGSYMAMALLTRTDRFRAAVISCGGYVNLPSAYASADDHGRTQADYYQHGQQGGMGCSLWDDVERYIRNSPLFAMDKVRTPVLIACGGDDWTSVEQGRQAFGALKELGQTVELRIYENEEHYPGVWSEESLCDVCSRAAEWFERYLLGSVP